MKEIRVKAWDKKAKRWLVGAEFADRLNFYNRTTAATLLGFPRTDIDNIEIVLSTGQKDRNGNEVFAGHILKYILPPEHGPDERPDIYVIEWAEYGFEARWANPPTPRASSDGHLSMQGIDKDMEIIGTIYENPELLEAAA